MKQVLVEIPSLGGSEGDGDVDPVLFNTWVSLQVFSLYFGETIGEFLTGVLSDKYPKSMKYMLLVILLLAALR